MSSRSPISLPALPIPSAGFFARLISDAMEVGLSRADLADSEVFASLDYLKSTDGTMHRVKAGKIVGDEHQAEVNRHLAILLTRPRWMPFHILPREELEMLLGFGFANQQGFSARLTDYPNIDGVLTRALLRTMMVPLAALFARCACHLPSSTTVAALDPWAPRTGLGDVLDELRRQARPRIGREDLCRQIVFDKSSWDRLRRGIVPPQAAFDFVKFTSLVVPNELERVPVEDALRRAFVAVRIIQGLKGKDGVKAGPDAEAFWADCAHEWKRIGQATADAARARPSLTRLRDMYPVMAEGSDGHWRYIWRDLVGRGEFGYFGWVCAFALALANSPRDAFAHMSADAAVLIMLDVLDKQLEIAAKLHETISKPPKTREELEAAFTAEPGQWLKRLELARFEVNEGDPRRALALLADPDLSSGHEYFPMLGEAYLKLGEYREAFAAFELALARSDSVQRVCASAARCCRELGDVKEATRYEKIASRLREPQL